MQYCLAKFEDKKEDVGCKFSCGELIFWMAEATLSDSSLLDCEKFSREELEKLKNDVIEIKKVNGYSDILNWNYESVFYDLRDVEVDSDEDLPF